MSKGLKITLIVIGSLVGIALLVCGGIFIGRTLSNRFNNHPNIMMWHFNGGMQRNIPRQKQYFHVRPRQPNSPMMYRSMPNMGPGRKGQFLSNKYTGNPISVDTARQAAEKYLGSLNNTDLTVKEIMVFNNNAYVAVIEKSTGKGAMELRVNPINLSVTPEMGPDRMWNQKYGMIGRQDTKTNLPNNQPITEMTVTPEQAHQDAQTYLDKNLAGAQAVADPLPFYGFYTFEYMKDGKPAGVLSVNGTSGQVWLHSGHGTFIEEWQAK